MNSRRRLSQQDLRTLGVTPGLMARKVGPDGERATVQQLAPEGPERRRDFVRRLTDENETSEGSKG